MGNVKNLLDMYRSIEQSYQNELGGTQSIELLVIVVIIKQLENHTILEHETSTLVGLLQHEYGQESSRM